MRHVLRVHLFMRVHRSGAEVTYVLVVHSFPLVGTRAGTDHLVRLLG